MLLVMVKRGNVVYVVTIHVTLRPTVYHITSAIIYAAKDLFWCFKRGMHYSYTGKVDYIVR